MYAMSGGRVVQGGYLPTRFDERRPVMTQANGLEKRVAELERRVAELSAKVLPRRWG